MYINNFFIYLKFKYILNIFKYNIYNIYGDWGLGIGDWGLGRGPNPQPPIPHPPSPNPQQLIIIF